MMGSPTVTAEFSTPSAQRPGDRAPVRRERRRRRHPAADRPPGLPAAEPRRRLHQTGLPAAPAGMEGGLRARRQARAARADSTSAPGYCPPATCARPPRRTRCRCRTSNCGCRRRTPRAAPKAWCRRPRRSTCRRATRWRATSCPAAPGAPKQTSGSNPNNTGVFTLAWEPTQAAPRRRTRSAQERGRRLDDRRERPDEPRIRVHGRQPGGRRDVELPRDGEQRRA